MPVFSSGIHSIPFDSISFSGWSFNLSRHYLSTRGAFTEYHIRAVDFCWYARRRRHWLPRHAIAYVYSCALNTRTRADFADADYHAAAPLTLPPSRSSPYAELPRLRAAPAFSIAEKDECKRAMPRRLRRWCALFFFTISPDATLFAMPQRYAWHWHTTAKSFTHFIINDIFPIMDGWGLGDFPFGLPFSFDGSME